MSADFELRERAVATKEGNVAVSYVACRALEDEGFLNAFSTRVGGVSPLPDHALHLTFRDDEAVHVDENRRRFLEAIGADWRALITVRQTHSDRRATIDDPATTGDGRDSLHPEIEADAILSRHDDALIAVKVADCVPILIADPKTGARAAIHAGWRGTLARITEKAVADLLSLTGGDPKNFVAAIGPSACGACYEVSEDVAGPFRETFGEAAHSLFDNGRGKWWLDVGAANGAQLWGAGLSARRIFRAPFCTMHQNDLFFSHRREGSSGKPVGRLLGVIGRKKS